MKTAHYAAIFALALLPAAFDAAAAPRPCAKACIDNDKIFSEDPVQKRAQEAALVSLSEKLANASLSSADFVDAIRGIAEAAVKNPRRAPQAMKILEDRAATIVVDGGKASSEIQNRKAAAVKYLYDARQEVAVQLKIHDHLWTPRTEAKASPLEP